MLRRDCQQYDAEEHAAQGVHRAAFLDALVHHVDAERAHFHKRCTHLTESPTGKGIVLNFQDGSTAEADVVLGADGIKSVVRDAVVGDGQKHMVFTNTVAYRGMIPATVLKDAGVKTTMDTRPLCWMGKDHVCMAGKILHPSEILTDVDFSKHIITFPIKGNTIVRASAFTPSTVM